jgi:hypothetical protein
MNREDTARCYALVCGAYEATAPNETTLAAWHMLIQDLDAKVALEATRRLCLRDSPFPPRPGEILAEVRRIRGEEPPSVAAAVGLYFADREDMHPLVQRAAAKCCFDRHRTDYDRARWEFRNSYEALLYEAEDEARQPSRQALGIAPAREHHRLELEAAERNRPVFTAIVEDEDPIPAMGAGPGAKEALARLRQGMADRARDLQPDRETAGEPT